MADEKTFAQIYREVKPIDTSRYFTNPFSSIGEFQRQVGYPIEALHKAYLQYFYKWADQSTPKPAVKVEPSVNERASMQNAGEKPITTAKMQLVIDERQLGVLKIPVPQIAAPVEEKVNVVEQPIVSKTTNIPYNTFVQNNLKSLQSRQDWVKNNADYLRAQGWSDADITGYKGQGNLNLRLASQLGGLEAWKKKQAEELALTKQQAIPVAKLEAPIQPAEPVLAETVLNRIPSTLLQPRTVEEARLQKARQLALSNSTIDQSLARIYFARNGQKRKTGGKIDYQKIFK